MNKERAELVCLLLNAVITRWDDTSITPLAINRIEWSILIMESNKRTHLATIQDVIQWLEMVCD